MAALGLAEEKEACEGLMRVVVPDNSLTRGNGTGNEAAGADIR